MPSLEIANQKLYNIFTRIFRSISVYIYFPAANYLNCRSLEGQIHTLWSLFSTYVSYHFAPAAVAQCLAQ